MTEPRWIDLPLPPISLLLEAIGYKGVRSRLAVYEASDQWWWSDSVIHSTASQYGWSAFIDHPLVAPRVGDPTANDWVCVDTTTSRWAIVSANDARRWLAKGHEISPTVAPPNNSQARITAHQQAVVDLLHWLDHNLPPLSDVEQQAWDKKTWDRVQTAFEQLNNRKRRSR